MTRSETKKLQGVAVSGSERSTSLRTLPRRELDDFEEAVGEFVGCEVHGDQVLVGLRESWSIVLPRSAWKTLRQRRVGERVAILRSNDDRKPIRVRLVPARQGRDSPGA